MQIITLNVNGVRAASRKGFFEWLPEQNADIICVQELKAQYSDLTNEILAPDGYYGYFHFAQKKGIAGSAFIAVKDRIMLLRVSELMKSILKAAFYGLISEI